MSNQFSIDLTISLDFGEGSLLKLSDHLKRLEVERPAIIISPSFQKSDYFKRVEKNLTLNSVNYTLYPHSQEPSVEQVDTLASIISTTEVDAIVGIGGGSVLDMAKALSVVLPFIRKEGKVSVKQFLEGVGTLPPPPREIPLLLSPTTAGTGSESTNNAVISQIGANGFKKSLRGANYYADVAIIDPTTQLGLKHSVTAASGLDALTQLLEAYTSTTENKLLKALTLSGISSLALALKPLLEGEESIQLRSDAAYGAYISGIAISRLGLGHVHGLGGPMGSLYPIAHGVACGKLLAPINRAMREAPNNDNYIALMRDVEKVVGTDVWDYLEELDKLANFPPLSEYGFTQSDLLSLSHLKSSRNSSVILPQETIFSILSSL